MKKNEFIFDGVTYYADDVGYEYSQLDGDSAGRSDDGTMYRDVIGLTNKVYYDFKDYREEEEIAKLLNLLEKTSGTLKYYDLKELKVIEKNMYVVGDKVQAKIIGDQFTVEPFQIRFIQMDVDDIG